MDLVLSFVALTFLVLSGAFVIYGFVHFLRTRSSRHGMYHGDAFSADPRPTGTWNLRRTKYRNTAALLERSLTAARQIASGPLRTRSRGRAL
jgi:hypothetical protein